MALFNDDDGDDSNNNKKAAESTKTNGKDNILCGKKHENDDGE